MPRHGLLCSAPRMIIRHCTFFFLGYQYKLALWQRLPGLPEEQVLHTVCSRVTLGSFDNARTEVSKTHNADNSLSGLVIQLGHHVAIAIGDQRLEECRRNRRQRLHVRPNHVPIFQTLDELLAQQRLNWIASRAC